MVGKLIRGFGTAPSREHATRDGAPLQFDARCGYELKQPGPWRFGNMALAFCNAARPRDLRSRGHFWLASRGARALRQHELASNNS